MPLNYAYAWGRSQSIKQQLKKSGLTTAAANLPIIYVPGIIGTKLYDCQKRVNIWGDPMALLKPNPNHAPFALDDSALTAWDNRHQPQPKPRVIATEQLHAFAIIPKLLETLVTKELAYVLENALGYKEGRDLFFLGYDWRQDYRLLSLQLDECMAHIRHVFGDSKVILIGQSVANQAMTYWLQKTAQDNYNRIARWYSFGPTWQGTFHALSMLHTGYYPASKRFKGFTPTDISSCPSCYQLLPTQPKVVTAKGELVTDFSFLDAACWQEFNLGPWSSELRDTLTPEKLDQFLALSKTFNQDLTKDLPKVRKISQAWFLSDANQAVYAAVAQGSHLLMKAKDIIKHAPEFAFKALAPGDDHLPLQDFIDQPNGAFVRDYKNIPYGENYMLVGQPKDHRALINYGPNLQALAFDLAVTRREYA